MSMINSSTPRITAKVTMAPITPATARDIPPRRPLELLEPELELLDEPAPPAKLAAEHTPVLLPQAWHQSAWLPMAKLFMPLTKSFHGRGERPEPKSGYSVGVEMLLVVPLWKRKRTLMSLVLGMFVLLTVALVTSSQVRVEA